MDKRNFKNGQDLPLGFGMALAQNQSAMAYFSALPAEEKQIVIDKTHSINSKREMKNYVDNLVSAPSFESFNGENSIK